MFWKKNCKPFLVSKPISFSFLVHFEWSKNLKVCQLKIYKTFLKSKCNKTMKKEFISKFEIVLLVYHQTWIPLHKTTHIFLIPWPNWTFFVALETLDGRLQMIFQQQKQRNNVQGVKFSFEILSVWWYACLP
jgi:hypothetical protein